MASGSMIPTGWPTPVRLLPPTAPVVDGDGSVTADFWLNQQTHIITFTLLVSTTHLTSVTSCSVVVPLLPGCCRTNIIPCICTQLQAVALTLLATGFCAFLSIQRARKRRAQTAAAAKQVQPNEEIESRLTPPRRSKKSRRETKRKPFQLRVAVSTTKTTRMGWDDLGKTESGMYRYVSISRLCVMAPTVSCPDAHPRCG